MIPLKDLTLLLNAVRDQKRILIARNPDLVHFFVPVKLHSGESVDFLPIHCFRDFDIFSGDTSFLSKKNTRDFLSSGSTQDKRAQHRFSPVALANYAKGACDGFLNALKRFSFSSKTPILSFIPRPSEWPTSSLAEMLNMFGAQGLNVRYVNENSPDEFLGQMAEIDSEVIVFGTSFHHYLCYEQFKERGQSGIFTGKKIGIFDTGGTKGRTKTLSEGFLARALQTLYLKNSQQEFYFLSEYGMCELSSQAYSTENPHGGNFVCNDGLYSVTVDSSLTTEATLGSKGFLGFIDSRNTDSYMAVLTEDLALELGTYPKNCAFKLFGRAPDATLKGCSLNVKEGYFRNSVGSASLPGIYQSDFFKESESSELLASKALELLEKLKASPVWSVPLLDDLRRILIGLTRASKSQNALKRKNQKILIVCSANIPVTWIYPTVEAALQGVTSVHLQLPSLRADDPLASIIREQIKSLVTLFQKWMSPLEIFLEEDFSVPLAQSVYNAIVVFGSDSTIERFKKEYASASTEIIGLGDVRNALVVKGVLDFPEVAAIKGSAWLGRGCLTPLVIFFLEKPSHESVEKFVEVFESRFAETYRALEVSPEFFHQHHIFETKAKLKSLGLKADSLVIAGNGTEVINLLSLSPEQISASEIDLTSGGMGLVYLIHGSSSSYPNLTTYPSSPKLTEKHMTHSWAEWFVQTL